MVKGGEFQVRIHDIPSSRIRERVVKTIKSWFGGVDSLEAEKRLSRKGAVLISGVDEDSAERILAALKRMKATGEIQRVPEARGFAGKLLNWGLALSGAALILAIISGGLLGLLFFFAALAAPVVVALTSNDQTPLAPAAGMDRDDLTWFETARKYQAKIGDLDEASRAKLREFTESILALRMALKSDSVASHAAGGTGGSLYERLPGAIEAGIGMSAEMAKKEGRDLEELEQELARLTSSANTALDSLLELDKDGPARAKELSEELNDISARVDDIIREIRPAGESIGRGRLNE